MMVSVTRRYRFSASHRLHTELLTETENARVFGKCNNPYGHGHDYELDVTVTGGVDAETGQVIRMDRLDSYVQDQVLNRFANRYINVDVPEFRDLVPTTENVVLVIARLLREHWTERFGAGGPQLARIHVQETGRNGFELSLAERKPEFEADGGRVSMPSEAPSGAYV
jgi:6-pyruvoyltetrahydropterin/6-carboxytetrahydropterin synthase